MIPQKAIKKQRCLVAQPTDYATGSLVNGRSMPRVSGVLCCSKKNCILFFIQRKKRKRYSSFPGRNRIDAPYERTDDSTTPIPIALRRAILYMPADPKNSGERLWLSRSTVPFIAMTMALLPRWGKRGHTGVQQGTQPLRHSAVKMGKVSHQSEDTASGRTSMSV